MKQLAFAVLVGVCAGACGHKAEPAGDIAGLFAASKAPALAGPLAKLHWGMPYDQAVAGGAHALDRGSLVIAAAGMGQPLVLASVGVRSSQPADLHALATAAWGMPYVDLGGGAGIWVAPEPHGTPALPYGDATRAVVTDTLLLSPYRSLAHWLGAGPSFGFEETGLLTGMTDREIQKRFASRMQAGSTTIQLGYDEIDLWLVSYGFGPDRIVHQFGFDVPMPTAARAMRSKLVLDRFGLTALGAPGAFFPLPGGAREASVTDTNGHWSVVVRDLAGHPASPTPATPTP